MSKFPPQFSNGEINDVIVVQADVFKEDRGCAYTTYNDLYYYNSLKEIRFCEEKISITEPYWGRGLHADDKNWKLITCVGGYFALILLDGRLSSKTYGKASVYQLKYNSGTQILVPPGVYNGHMAGYNRATLHYAWSHGYEGPEAQKTVSFYDEVFGFSPERIEIMKGAYKLSDRDQNHTTPFKEAGFE